MRGQRGRHAAHFRKEMYMNMDNEKGIEKMELKRMGLFKFHDRDGIVDCYVEFLLDDVAKSLSDLIIICNGSVKDSQVKKLKRYTDRVIIRDDKGLDAGAFKAAICEHVSHEELMLYDEIVFFNDEFYGPFYSFKHVFDEMSSRTVDFWGITGNRANRTGQYDYVQTYFYAMRKSLVKSEAFKTFWKSIPGDIKTSEILFAEYELFLTHYFSTVGFTWDVLVDTSLHGLKEADKCNGDYGIIDYILLKDYNCPVIKRMNFIYPAYKINIGNNESTALAFDYICRCTDYDENMIWDNLLRLYNVKELTDCLNLNFILPTEASIGQSEQGVSDIPNSSASVTATSLEPAGYAVDAGRFSRFTDARYLSENKAAVIIYLSNQHIIIESLDYIYAIPDWIHVIIVLKSAALVGDIKKIAERFPEKHIRIVPANAYDHQASALLITCREFLMTYDLLCFVHDEITERNKNTVDIMSLFHNIWHNTLQDTAYILNVINTFDKNPRLGFLSPPKPHHAYYFNFFFEPWNGGFEETSELAERLELRCNISDKYGPVSVSGAFWCRSAALKTLFTHEFTHDDFYYDSIWSEGALNQAVNYIYPYVAQHNGYYSGILMSNEYAASELKNLNCFLEDITMALSGGTVYVGSSIQHILKSIQSILDKNNEVVSEFSNSYKHIYLYGSGVVAQRIAKLFSQRGIPFEGLLVSDDFSVADREVYGYNVYTLEEIEEYKDDCGIVLAMSDRYYSKAEARLRLYGFKNILGRGVI